MKAGLFDRAEAAYHALEGTALRHRGAARAADAATSARATGAPPIEVAQQLETAGTGSFARRISHYWCELALDGRGSSSRPDEAERALQQALQGRTRRPRARW